LIVVHREATPKLVGALNADLLYRSCDVGGRRYEYWVLAGEWACPEVRRAEDGVVVVQFGPLKGAGYPIEAAHLRPPGFEGTVLSYDLRAVQPHRTPWKADRDINITVGMSRYVLGWRDKRVAIVRPDSSVVAQRRRQWRLAANANEAEMCLAVAIALSDAENALDSPVWDFLP
jgi:hypothetical protein